MTRQEQVEQLALDCVYFHGDRPCVPHTRQGETCRCDLFAPQGDKILVIQLSDPAEVVRSTALLQRLRKEHPNGLLVFLTDYPELVEDLVDEALSPDALNVLRLQVDRFDTVYNLDMSKRACALVNVLSAEVKKGFHLQQGLCFPLDADAFGAYLEANSPQSIPTDQRLGPVRRQFALCGLEYHAERPSLAASTEYGSLLPYDGVVVALHTVCDQAAGDEMYFWEESRWSEVADCLSEQDAVPVLFGSSEAEYYNLELEWQSSAISIHSDDRRETLSNIAACDIVVTTPGPICEIALAQGKAVVLLLEANQSPPAHGGEQIIPLVATDSNGLESVLPDKVIGAVQACIEKLPPKPKSPDFQDAENAENGGFQGVRAATSELRQSPARKK